MEQSVQERFPTAQFKSKELLAKRESFDNHAMARTPMMEIERETKTDQVIAALARTFNEIQYSIDNLFERSTGMNVADMDPRVDPPMMGNLAELMVHGPAWVDERSSRILARIDQIREILY